jgi:hypothetical protein
MAASINNPSLPQFSREVVRAVADAMARDANTRNYRSRTFGLVRPRGKDGRLPATYHLNLSAGLRYFFVGRGQKYDTEACLARPVSECRSHGEDSRSRRSR